MKRIQDMPQWHGRNRYDLRFDCLDVQRQITVLLDVFGDTHLHKQKIVSDLTKKKRAYTIYQFINDVHESGLHIKNLLNIDQRHITAAVQVWKEKKAAASTIQTSFSILRWLTKTLGKSGLIMPIEYYGLTQEDVARTYVAKKDKSWSSNQVVPARVRQFEALSSPGIQ